MWHELCPHLDSTPRSDGSVFFSLAITLRFDWLFLRSTYTWWAEVSAFFCPLWWHGARLAVVNVLRVESLYTVWSRRTSKPWISRWRRRCLPTRCVKSGKRVQKDRCSISPTSFCSLDSWGAVAFTDSSTCSPFSLWASSAPLSGRGRTPAPRTLFCGVWRSSRCVWYKSCICHTGWGAFRLTRTSGSCIAACLKDSEYRCPILGR